LPGPQISASSFKNYANPADTGLTPGGLVLVEGAGIAPGSNGTYFADLMDGRLPDEIRGTSVVLTWTGGSYKVPVFAISNEGGREWLLFQAPYELIGPNATAVVTVTGGGNATVTNIPVKPYSPGILEDIISGRRAAVLIKPDGSRVSPQNPARRGEKIRMYTIGLGQTSPQAYTNFVGRPDQMLLAGLTLGINYAGVQVTEAYMALNLFGVYEVVFVVPADAPIGNDIPLNFSVDVSASERYFSNDSLISIAQ
jgi:uncharacterized protein (TIGR03437 family)